MNKIINKPDDMISEMLEGYLSLYPTMFKKVEQTCGLIRREKSNKVSIVIGGGSGNEPWVIGYVGSGLANGAALGAIYASPPAKSVLNVTKAVSHDKGVVYIAANHTGDVLNFELSSELAALEGIETRCIFVSDDVTSAPKENKNERRGIAGIALIIKIAGAACESGMDLEEVVRIVSKANDNISTCSITTSPGYFPGNGQRMFDLPDGIIAYGMGFNGEPGIKQTPLTTADEIAQTLMNYLLGDCAYPGDEIAVMINGYGFTSVLELYILSGKVHQILKDKDFRIHDLFIDTLFCPQGMGGLSISILKLDNELKRFYDMPAYSPLFKKELIKEQENR